MWLAKTSSFTDKQNRLANIAKALAHPARITILEVLLARKACMCSDLGKELSLAQAAVSQHLKELRRVGLIKGDIDPPRVCSCIHENGWNETYALLTVFLGQKGRT